MYEIQEYKEQRTFPAKTTKHHKVLTFVSSQCIDENDYVIPVFTEIPTSRSILCPTTDNQSDSTREFGLLFGSVCNLL